LEYFAISNQVLDRFLDVFTRVESFPLDKILFTLSFSSFVDNGLDN